MTRGDRLALRQAIDQCVRQRVGTGPTRERLRHNPRADPLAQCKGCGCLYDDLTAGCTFCAERHHARDRRRLPAHWLRARSLRAQGLTYSAIGRELGVDHTSVIYMCDDDYRRRRREYQAAYRLNVVRPAAKDGPQQ